MLIGLRPTEKQKPYQVLYESQVSWNQNFQQDVHKSLKLYLPVDLLNLVNVSASKPRFWILVESIVIALIHLMAALHSEVLLHRAVLLGITLTVR